MTMGKAFGKSSRLLRGAEFRRVFNARCSLANHCLIVYGARNELDHSRLGLAVSKKVGNAVIRNRWKRRIREAFRLRQHQLPTGWDWVVLPKRGAHPDSETIHKSLATLVEKVAMRNRAK